MYRSRGGSSFHKPRNLPPSGSVSHGSSFSRAGIADLPGSPNRSPQGTESSPIDYSGLVGHRYNASVVTKVAIKIIRPLVKLWRSIEHFLDMVRDTNFFDTEKLAPIDKSISFSLGNSLDVTTSMYHNLFPGMTLDCYKQLIPWIADDCPDAAEALDIILPDIGPMVSVDLGYILAAVVAQYDLKNLIMPGLSRKQVLDVKFLHVDISQTMCIREFILTLIAFDGYVGAIDTATHAGAQSFASVSVTS